MNINEAIKTMKEKVTDPIAVKYLENMFQAIEEGGMRGMCVQLKYIMENVKSWRGEEAREVKAFVRQWVEDKEATLRD